MIPFALLLCLLNPAHVHGQAWSGIIDPSRAIDWKNVGMGSQTYGNVPHNTTVCSTLGTAGQLSTFAQSITAAQINSAIAGCAANQVVFLNAGTYTLSSAINYAAHNNVTLRGAGPTQTVVKFTGSSGCTFGQPTDVCIEGSTLNYGPGPNNLTTWTAGYATGTTVITLGSVSGLSVGQLIILDQANDTTDTSQVLVCDNANGSAFACDNDSNGPTQSGRTVSGVDYSQQQMVKVTAINGNNVTIDTPLYMPNWRSSQTPGAWWSNSVIQNSGIENMTLDHSNGASGPGGTGIKMFNTYRCWVRNVRGINSDRANVQIYLGAHNVIRDSYFYGTQNAMTQSYGVEIFQGTDNLVINNIFQHVTSPLLHNTGSGTVEAYNYDIDNFGNNPGFLFAGPHWNHAAGSDMLLTEGDFCLQYLEDAIHGSHNFNTAFRNFCIGPDGAQNSQTATINLASHARYENVIGGVYGKAGYHNNYQVTAGGSLTNCQTSIFEIGLADICSNSSGGVTNDSLVASTLMRWGNYDVVNNAVRFVASEVPSGISPFANAVPATQTVPTSFFLVSGGVPYTRAPTWWATAYGTPAWPPIGPDVTGGTVTSGSGTGSNLGFHVYRIPAVLCQQNLPQDSTNYPSTTILAYDAATCYPSESAAAPDSQSGGGINQNAPITETIPTAPSVAAVFQRNPNQKGQITDTISTTPNLGVTSQRRLGLSETDTTNAACSAVKGGGICIERHSP